MTGRVAVLTEQLFAVFVLSFVAIAAFGQDAVVSDDDEARLARLAERFERNARVLTLFDRAGNVTATVGERDLYVFPTLSPDGARIAVIIGDPVNERNDLWVIDIPTGERTRITEHKLAWDLEWVSSVAWSPDGTELAFVRMRDGYEGIYRISADGAGEEEFLYRHPGANLWLGDWSPDGQLLSVSTADLVEGRLYILPMDGDGEREITQLLKRDAPVMAGNFSPDGTLLVYRSEETGANEIYAWNLEENEVALQVSDGGGLFTFRGSWDPDRNQIYYLAPGEGVVAARIDRPPAGSTAVERTELFSISPAVRPGPVQSSISRDGERILIAVPHSPQLEQITIFDRHGNIVQRVGEPLVWRNPSLSPDGSKVAVQGWQIKSNFFDIWVFDLESGAESLLTSDSNRENWPIWSPDGNEVAYMAQRDEYAYIVRHPVHGMDDVSEIYRYEPGAFLNLADWSPDGDHISFNDGCYGVLYIVPLSGEAQPGNRTAMEWLRDEYLVAAARFSPDSRYIAYLTDEVEPDVFNLYIAPFDPGQPDGRVPDAVPLQVSTDNVLGMVSWHEDGDELYYLTNDWEVMAIEVRTDPQLQVGESQLLFELPGPLPGEPRQWKSATPDGQRFVFVLNVPVTID